MVEIYLPGEKITDSKEFIQGHGTYQLNDCLHSSLFGRSVIINKLLSVYTIADYRYSPNIGDVVVARVTSFGNKRWKVEMNSKNDATLHLSAINLPGGIQRRKLESDEMKMREYFDIKDVLVAEVQKINRNGVLALHTRNEKYKRLDNGLLEKVPCMLIKRYKTHFIKNGAVDIILGVNGYIWIGTESEKSEDLMKVGKIKNYLNRCADEMEIVNDDILSTL